MARPIADGRTVLDLSCHRKCFWQCQPCPDCGSSASKRMPGLRSKSSTCLHSAVPGESGSGRRMYTVIQGSSQRMKTRGANSPTRFVHDARFEAIGYDNITCPQYSHLSMPSSSVPPQFGHWKVSTLIGNPWVLNADSFCARSPRRRFSRAR